MIMTMVIVSVVRGFSVHALVGLRAASRYVVFGGWTVALRVIVAISATIVADGVFRSGSADESRYFASLCCFDKGSPFAFVGLRALEMESEKKLYFN